MGTTTSPSDSAVVTSREVRAVVGRLRRRLRSSSREGDLTPSESSVLARLADKGGVTVSELAAIEGVRHQSMTSVVNALVEAGLVDRSPDPGDGRRQLVALTTGGRQHVERGREARTEWLATRLRRACTEQERETVRAAMAILDRISS